MPTLTKPNRVLCPQHAFRIGTPAWAEGAGITLKAQFGGRCHQGLVDKGTTKSWIHWLRQQLWQLQWLQRLRVLQRLLRLLLLLLLLACTPLTVQHGSVAQPRQRQRR